MRPSVRRRCADPHPVERPVDEHDRHREEHRREHAADTGAHVEAQADGELDGEIERGAWYVLEPDAALAMRKPEGLWEELVQRLKNRENTI